MSACQHNVTMSRALPKMGGTVVERVCTQCSVVVSQSFEQGPRLTPPPAESAIGHAFERIEALERRLSRVFAAVRDAYPVHRCDRSDGGECPWCELNNALEG